MINSPTKYPSLAEQKKNMNEYSSQANLSGANTASQRTLKPSASKADLKPIIQKKDKKVVKVIIMEDDDSGDNVDTTKTNNTLLQFTQLLQTPSDYSYQDSFHEEKNSKLKGSRNTNTNLGGTKLKKPTTFGKTSYNAPKYEPQQFVKRDLFQS